MLHSHRELHQCTSPRPLCPCFSSLTLSLHIMGKSEVRDYCIGSRSSLWALHIHFWPLLSSPSRTLQALMSPWFRCSMSSQYKECTLCGLGLFFLIVDMVTYRDLRINALKWNLLKSFLDISDKLQVKRV